MPNSTARFSRIEDLAIFCAGLFKADIRFTVDPDSLPGNYIVTFEGY